MHHHTSSCRLNQQAGAALLILMIIMFLAASSWILNQNESAAIRNRMTQQTASALAQAKEALTGRAATNGNLPGSLSCPDTNDDGVADGNFGNCDAFVGRLPWKTLDTPELRDGNGEHLWYALSAKLRDNPASRPINPLQPLDLSIDGTPNIAAVIFSPGTPLENQTGRPNNVITDYLDGSNNDGDNNYISGPPSQTFNDKALAISRDELFATVNQRVLGEIRGPDDNTPGTPSYGLRRYHNDHGAFPWADNDNDGFGDVDTATGGLPYNDLVLPATPPPTNPPYPWLTLNGWLPLVNYQRTNADLVAIDLGTGSMTITPCPNSPCP